MLESEESTEGHQREIKPTTQTKPKQQVQQEPKSEHDPGKQPRKDYSDYVRKCAEELHDGIGVDVVDIYLKKRGFTRETIEQYQLGAKALVPCYDQRHRLTYSPGVIVPFIDTETGEIPYYITRLTREDTEERYKNLPKSEAGGLPLYHPASLYNDGICFITEGAFDAISIIQVGGEAVALNGTGNMNRLIEVLREKPTASTLIVCFDNDGSETTAKSALELTRRLQDMGFRVVCDNSL